MRKIKICGLSREEDIEAANRFRPDFIGFVFAESSRRVSRETAGHLRSLLLKSIPAVGVFVNEAPDCVVSLLEENIIDMAQLHGDEDEEEIRYIKKKCGKPVLRAVRVRSIEDIRKAGATAADYLLFDEGRGSGNSFDWKILKQYLSDKGEPPLKPYFLAGGISLENIASALEIPSFGIDLSGGAETDGKKDPEKMEALILAVHGNGIKS